MRVVFIGMVDFSYSLLQELVCMEGVNVVGVVTGERDGFNTDYSDVTPLCRERGIPFKVVGDINQPDNVNYIRALRPDVIYCFGWSRLIKAGILGIPPLGVVGYHPSALPANRGRHPLIWALVLGLSETASSFFLMDEKPDNGEIISQVTVPIGYSDDARSLYDRITLLAVGQMKDFTRELVQNGKFGALTPNTAGNFWRKRTASDGLIDFRMSSYSIYNLVRALTKPYVGAHVRFKNMDVKIWRVKEEAWNVPNIEPGKVLKVEGGNLLVKTGDAAIWLLEHEFEEQMPGDADYFI